MWSLVSVGQQGPPDDRGFANIQFLIPIAVVIVILLLVLIGILIFPRLRSVKASKPLEPEVHRIEEKSVKGKQAESPIDVTIRLLHDDERRVVEALSKAGGSMLQKDISYELKLSRVKTHRVLVGLIERGVVKAEKHYNTNMITLSDWLISTEGESSSKDNAEK